MEYTPQYEPNKVIMINAADLIADEELYVNKVNGKTVKAKHMTGKFTISNERGDERTGDPGDWLVEDGDGTLRVVDPQTFEGCYGKKVTFTRITRSHIIDDLGNDCKRVTLMSGDACQYCSVCDKLVGVGWVCVDDYYHEDCIEWEG